jgi:hypothetical protein
MNDRQLSRRFSRRGVRSQIKEDKAMFREGRQLLTILAIVWLAAPLVGAAQSESSKGTTFQWSGELVAADSATSTFTVKSRIAYQEAVSELKQFKPGEKVWVVWSGIHDYGDAVRQVRPMPAGKKIDEDLVLPAELVSNEAPNQYLTIRVKVPEGSLAAITDVKPGQWVTVTSRHRPSTEAEAVVTVKPYGASSTT